MDLIGVGLEAVLHPSTILLMAGGVLLGLAFGAIPGMSATIGMILFLPLTFFLPPEQGVLFLVAIWLSGVYAGSIPAIVLNIPGTAASVATALDGYPLALAGNAHRAIRASIVGSVLGGLISAVALVFFSLPLAQLALRFRPPEMFAFALFGLTIVVTLSSGALIRGLLAGLIGMALATVGFGPAGTGRFTYNVDLLDGFPIVIVLIGLFTLPQIMDLIAKGAKSVVDSGSGRVPPVPMGRFLLKADDWRQHGFNFLRSGAVGTFVGIMPGSGPTVAGFVGYNEARRVSKKPESFGKGNIDGVIAADTANNAAVLSALIPTLTLGIPGSVTCVIIIAALQVHGVFVGPQLFEESGDLVAAIFAGAFLVHFILLAGALTFSRPIASITRVPIKVLTPTVFVLAMAGAYAVRNNTYDVVVAGIIGLIGYGLHLMKIPLAPLILAATLGPIVERHWFLTMQLYGDNYGSLFTRPIFVAFLLITVATLIFAFRRDLKGKSRSGSIVKTRER